MRRDILLYMSTIFVGAFLLFLVQPYIAKFILPWFGGGPAIWTTCMLYFQVVLLGSYAYAHLLCRSATPRTQVIVHSILLLIALAFLPIIPDVAWKPDDANAPTARILLLLIATVGMPYFMVASTAPLLQAWFAQAHPGRSPYRLYALSNFGSLLALLSFPVAFEPTFSRAMQGWIWSSGFALYAVLSLTLGVRQFRLRSVRTATTPETSTEGQPVTPLNIGMWLALSMTGSVMLLAITNQMSEDITVVPFLWVLPLALYLLTFILAFADLRWYRRSVFFVMLVLAFLWMARADRLGGPGMSILEQVAGYCGVLFATCMVCHGELSRLRPRPRHLTSYYLALSVGGAMGGAFVALVAPVIFDGYHELPIGLAATAALLLVLLRLDPESIFSDNGRLIPYVLVVAFFGWNSWQMFTRDDPAFGDTVEIARARNFYGVLGIRDGASPPYRMMNHGRTTHGLQLLDPAHRGLPTTYYGPTTGGGALLSEYKIDQPRRIGIVGLGAGTMAVYGTPQDHIRFYEINPDVERLAREYFTFLDDTPADTVVIEGDARLVLEREDPQHFDVLVLDAFSGHAIAVHLLTQEAFEIYDRHLADDGVIAAHISNPHLDLTPVARAAADHLGMTMRVVTSPEDQKMIASEARWVLITHNPAALHSPDLAALLDPPEIAAERIAWTDDWCNLLGVVDWD